MAFLSITPLRVSLLGGGTDYNEYFLNNKGSVLGGTINKHIYTFAHDLPSFSDQKFRVSYRNVENCDSIDEISHPVVREVLRHFNVQGNLSISTSSELPGSSGLGSSSAFTVGLVNLISSYCGLNLRRDELFRLSVHIEQVLLAENVGIQDQIQCLMTHEL